MKKIILFFSMAFCSTAFSLEKNGYHLFELCLTDSDTCMISYYSPANGTISFGYEQDSYDANKIQKLKNYGFLKPNQGVSSFPIAEVVNLRNAGMDRFYLSKAEILAVKEDVGELKRVFKNATINCVASGVGCGAAVAAVVTTGGTFAYFGLLACVAVYTNCDDMAAAGKKYHEALEEENEIARAEAREKKQSGGRSAGGSSTTMDGNDRHIWVKERFVREGYVETDYSPELRKAIGGGGIGKGIIKN